MLELFALCRVFVCAVIDRNIKKKKSEEEILQCRFSLRFQIEKLIICEIEKKIS